MVGFELNLFSDCIVETYAVPVSSDHFFHCK